MKRYAVMAVWLLAACANQRAPVTEESAALPEIWQQQDMIGAVVSLLDTGNAANANDDQTAAVQAASDIADVSELEQENQKLRQKVNDLTAKVKQLESRPKPPPPPKHHVKKTVQPPKQPSLVLPKPEPILPPDDAQEVPTLSEIAPIAAQNDLYAQATKAYQQKQFQRVVKLLRHMDGGGNGSESARKQMYLLLLSHQKLNNCQSVISIGQRLAGQFSGSHEAAEAQFMVGQCQWNIQQRDIAKDTWRKLIASQPNTAAAKRAKTALLQQ